LYDQWIENNSGEIFNTFTIITTDANDLMTEIHNSAKRMPVTLDRSSETGWIDLSTSPDDALSMLKPCSSEILKAHTISPAVNDRKSDRNTPDVIKPYNYHPGDQLF
jgi:putative SOS response-associated peptidase YedK